jgi:outer membrane lipoprotein SlyB
MNNPLKLRSHWLRHSSHRIQGAHAYSRLHRRLFRAADRRAAAPSLASAQVWRSDPCRSQRHEAARTGAIAGGLIGALVGSQIAGRGSHTAGAVVGGAAGAVAGHQIGAHSVERRAYPAGYRHHPGRHWMIDTYHGRTRSYEVCRTPDGAWRPYGSS